MSVCVRADPGRLSLQDVQRCGWVDGQLQPHRTSEQQAVQHADALQGASSSLVTQELALGRLRGFREVVQGLFLLRHLGRRSSFFSFLSEPFVVASPHTFVAEII